MRRLHKLEGAFAPRVVQRPPQLRIGPLKQLPEDYVGERHIVALNRSPRACGGEECGAAGTVNVFPQAGRRLGELYKTELPRLISNPFVHSIRYR